jgi:hypothetical protein
MTQVQQQQSTKTDRRKSLRARIRDVLQIVDGVDVDVDLIFEKIEAALRKHLKLSFAQCDAVLTDVRVEVEQLVDDWTGSSIDFHEALDLLVDEFAADVLEEHS